MLNIYFLTLVLFFLYGCNKNSSNNRNNCNPSNETCLFGTIGVYANLEGVPNEAYSFDTEFIFNNFSLNEQDKINKAAELIKQVIASDEFLDEILHFSFDGVDSFVDSGGLSNAQIYWRILQGAEKLFPENNHRIDAELVLYYEASTIIGYTKPETSKIWLNTKYFNIFSPYQVAGNLTHEWMHKLGFGHSSEYTTSRSSSVPYAVGYIMERLSRKFSY